MSPYRKNVTSLVIFYCLAIWLFGVTWAWGQSEHTTKLIKGAKKEGKLIWYTAMNISDSKRLLDAFEKKYPFVRTELFRASGERSVNRIITETRAGKWNFDLVALGRAGILVQHKLILPYVSPEAKAYVQEFKDPAGH